MIKRLLIHLERLTMLISISAIRFHYREVVAGEYLNEIFWQKNLVDRVKNLKYFLKCSSH